MLVNAGTHQGLKRFRKNLVRVIHAVADKGMDYPLKIDVLTSLEYCPLIASFEMKYRERNF